MDKKMICLYKKIALYDVLLSCIDMKDNETLRKYIYPQIAKLNKEQEIYETGNDNIQK